jgi:type IV pilus assembly protein PilW
MIARCRRVTVCRESAALAGFTILELLVVVALAGVAGATAINLFRVQKNVFRSQNRSAEVDQNLRAAIDLMTRELRNAGMHDPREVYVDPPGIALADSHHVRFTTDFQGAADMGPDGDARDPHEDIEYSHTPGDGTLRRRTRGESGDSGAQPMAEYVTGVRFLYLDNAGRSLPTPVATEERVAIRTIQVRLWGGAPGGGSATALETAVLPRNVSF